MILAILSFVQVVENLFRLLSFGRTRRHIEYFLKRRASVLQVAPLRIEVSEIQIGRGVIRRDPDRIEIGGFGCLVVTRLCKSDAEIAVEQRVFRVQLDRGLKVGDGLAVPILLVQPPAFRVMLFRRPRRGAL